MKIKSHTLGFPRIGLNRELKFAQEKYWSGEISLAKLLSIGKNLRETNWKKQKDLGIDFVPVGDFSWYDHVLDMTMMLGNIPKRHKNLDNSITLDTYFRIARGKAPIGQSTSASDMTKWFNTNYHYIVPEFRINAEFHFSWRQLLDEIDEAILLKHKVKPVILGPLTYLWLGKVKGINFNKLDLVKDIIPIYCYLFTELTKRKIVWIQIDEPILVLELSEEWKKCFNYTYESLYNGYNKLLLTTYFGSIEHNLNIISRLPIQGLHLDLVYGNYDLLLLNSQLPKEWLISLGIINGRNIWKSDLLFWFNKLQLFLECRSRIWIGTSCSLLHTPIDIQYEKRIKLDIKNWFAFSLQKCEELTLLKNSLNNKTITEEIKEWSQSIHDRSRSKLVHNSTVQKRINSLSMAKIQRNSKFSIRMAKQYKHLNLPLLPTTTIGSFPQTSDIRNLRSDFKNGKIDQKNYRLKIFKLIKEVIKKQEEIGLDVLVHGEFERNDMVEYFGEHLNGFVFTDNGWVQSYGSRCVKPPIIVGDVSRSDSISVDYIKYAQSLTHKPVKGMLTGPVTILCWSFIREDVAKDVIAKQIALALNDEVLDLEKSGIGIIQIDEPALREGLPLRRSLWHEYLSWAIEVFKLSYSGIRDETQIHTHMCYCEFNDIMHAITLLDADVITIETSRSDMDLLEFFKDFSYPNQIGPGVYDIHSPNIPRIDWILRLLNKAKSCIPVERLWVNPDCGLKTRTWEETEKALKNMVKAAKIFRTTCYLK